MLIELFAFSFVFQIKNQKLTFTAIVPTETGFALASAQDAFAIAVTSSWAAESHVTGQRDETGGLLRISIIVVKRNEPMARFHVMQYFLLYQRLVFPTQKIKSNGNEQQTKPFMISF